MPQVNRTRSESHDRQDQALVMHEQGFAYSAISRRLGFADGGGGAAAAVRAAERRRDLAANTNGFVYNQVARATGPRRNFPATSTRTRTTPTAPRRDARGRTFGIEAEFIGNVATTIAALQAVGIRCVDNTGSYNHQVQPTWKIVTDGSVHSTSRRGAGGRGLELVSPVLRGAAGLAEIKKALDAVRESGGVVNRTCGLHVHVGMDGLSGSHIMKVLDLYRTNESNINQLVAQTRRGSNNYCKLLSSARADYRNSYDTIRAVTNVSLDRVNPNISSAVRHVDRYYTVNVCAYARYGTLEFRQHQGTLVGNKAVTWVKFVLALIEKSITLDNAEVQQSNLAELADFLTLTGTTKRRLVARAEVLAGRR